MQSWPHAVSGLTTTLKFSEWLLCMGLSLCRYVNGFLCAVVNGLSSVSGCVFKTRHSMAHGTGKVPWAEGRSVSESKGEETGGLAPTDLVDRIFSYCCNVHVQILLYLVFPSGRRALLNI